MDLDFSKCKTSEDVDRVFKKKKVVTELKVIKKLLEFQLETSGIPPKKIKMALKIRRPNDRRPL